MDLRRHMTMSEGGTGTSEATGDRLLVPLDGSDEASAALPYVTALATAGTQITLVVVIPGSEEVIGVGGGPGASDEPLAIQARDAMEQIATELRQTGLTVETVVMAGDPAANILEAADGV